VLATFPRVQQQIKFALVIGFENTSPCPDFRICVSAVFNAANSRKEAFRQQAGHFFRLDFLVRALA